MTGPAGNIEFCFPRISMFPEVRSSDTLRFQTKANFEKAKVNFEYTLRFQRQYQTISGHVQQRSTFRVYLLFSI